MLDLATLRSSPEAIRHSMARRGLQVPVEDLANTEARIRQLRHEADNTRAAQRSLGKNIAGLRGEEKRQAIESAASLAGRIKELNARAGELSDRFYREWHTLPNLVDPSAADGLTEEDSQEVRRVGETRRFNFDPVGHDTLGERLDIIDTKRAAKVAGSRFGYLKGKGALLEFGLINWSMDHLVKAGLVPMITPVLVREMALFGTGFFPGDRQQVYEIPADELFLAATSEISLAAYHADEILDPEQLPIRYAGFSSCFRREAGTHGKDTGGIFRVHQFDKVEMFSFTRPEDSSAEHERILDLEEKLIGELEIPYRVVNVAAGDLGASAAKKYDIEAWFPSWNAYREVTSCSNTTDYQARRLKIRLRAHGGNRLVHTLNGTAVAVGRVIIALLENHQQSDGSVLMPEALHPYLGFDRIDPP
ncbi:MAG: serine--tRNA ligase [Acidimicrobiia bacterium]|nr:serine--tRNA ligase [bacterium]MDE0675666.1 serine--tRNA ligase [bacterium]MYA39754.1 serine--tRNA ligase [Acidimicrobiia bacterium]MYH06942.1 serine--tRNA ligase [Acidimicrobiia bacterium]MYK57008.1 serine--tRNA ligase [Acidimicrobiia bacterium]